MTSPGNYKFKGLTPNDVWVYGNLTILTFQLQEIPKGSYISDEPGFVFKHWVKHESVEIVPRGTQ